jgi:hypothetical protein
LGLWNVARPKKSEAQSNPAARPATNESALPDTSTQEEVMAIRPTGISAPGEAGKAHSGAARHADY